MIFELIVTTPIQDVNLTEYVLSYRDQASYDLEQFPIGQVPSKVVDIELDNGDGNLSEFISADDLLWTITLGEATGEYKVVERPEKYTGVVKVTFQDLILETEQPYKSVLEYPTSIAAQLAEMASIMGIGIDSSTLSAATLLTEVNWIDTRVSIRDYLSWIAELDAKNVEIDDQSVIKFKEISDTPVYATEDVESFVFDKQYSISKIRKDDGVAVLEVGNEDDYVLYLQSSNNYITTEAQVAAIYNSLNGKSWHSVNDFKMVGYDKLKLGDVIESGGIKFIAMSIDTTWSGGQYAIQVIQGPITPGNIQRTISVYDDRARINRIQTTIDEQKQELTILAEKQDTTSSEVAALTLSSSEISLRVSSVEETAGNTADDLENYKSEVADAINTIELTPGPPGTPAVQWTIGSDGYWYADGVKTDKKAIGEDGVDGDNPDIWTIGPNGNWFKNDVDTGQPSQGEDGVSQYIHIRYSANANGNPMTNSPQTTTEYIGLANTTSETAPDSYTGYTWSLIKGQDGEDGEDGIPGQPGEDGQTPYIHLAWANDDAGTDFSTTDSLGRTFLGTYVDFIEEDSENYEDYDWVFIKGQDGAPGLDGQPGESAAIFSDVPPEDIQRLWLDTSDNTLKQFMTVEEDGEQVEGWYPVTYHAEQTLSSRLDLTEEAINLEVSERQDLENVLRSEISSEVSLLSDSVTTTITNLAQGLDATDSEINEIKTHFRISEEGILLGKSDNPIEFYAEPDEVGFRENGVRIAYWKEGTMHVDNLIAILTIIIGYHQIDKYDSPIAGKTSVVRRGDI